MFKSKLFIVTAVIVFAFLFTNLEIAAAGEKLELKAHGANYMTTMHQLEVGDEEGHVLIIYEQKAIYFDEINGGRSVDRGVGFMDVNPNKPEEIFNQGYGVYTDKDGDKMIRTYKGRPIAKGQWKGVWTLKSGTGKHEGAKGGGTWESYTLAPEQSYVEVVGEIETP